MSILQRIQLTLGLICLAHYAAGPNWNNPVLDACLLIVAGSLIFMGLPDGKAEHGKETDEIGGG